MKLRSHAHAQRLGYDGQLGRHLHLDALNGSEERQQQKTLEKTCNKNIASDLLAHAHDGAGLLAFLLAFLRLALVLLRCV